MSSPIDTAVAIMQQRAGKDKTIKIIQYTGRLVLRASESEPLKHTALQDIAPRVAPLVKELSGFRKIIKFGDWVKTLRELINKPTPPTFFELVDLYNELVDDVYLLCKIGTLDKKYTNFFERQADLAWMISILHNIWSKRRGSGQIWRLDVSKLLCDFCFCYVDVARLNVDSSIQTTAGLLSAILAYYKIWLKMRV